MHLTASLIEGRPLLSGKFDLIVASSVGAFLPSYEQSLSLLKTVLNPGGRFVQWDWLVPETNADYGFTEKRVRDAFENTGLILLSPGQPFAIIDSKGKTTMPVLMGVAKNP